MKKLRVAVIGLGKMGLLHSSILSTIPEVEIAVLCDKSYVLRRIAKKLFKSSAVENEVEQIRDSSVDCAFVAAPIPAHFPIVKTLYSKSIASNVFVEKTLCSSWEQADQLCALSDKDLGVTMVGYMKRFSVTYSKAKRLLGEDILGEVIAFNGFAYSSDFADCGDNVKISARGGVLNDLGSHIIDLGLWFFGDFEVEDAELKSVVHEGSEDSAKFKVKKSELIGEFDISWCKENYRLPNFGITIQGTKGSLMVNDYNLVLQPLGKKRSVWYRQDLNDNVNFLIGEPEYYREDETFIKSIMNGNKVEPSFRTSSKVDYIIHKVKKAA